MAAGAARMVLDHELSGERLFHEVEELRQIRIWPTMRERMKNSQIRKLAERAATAGRSGGRTVE